MRFVVTGGAGFIGSAVVRLLIRKTEHEVLVVDKLTYAGNLANLREVAADPRFHFAKVDVCDRAALDGLFAEFAPDVVMHLAAETHVDRSIDGAPTFIETNVLGTHALLEAARAYWGRLGGAARAAFRFHHVSTDEVFGSLGPDGCFTEDSPYDPNSPYAASKAASDHFVRAWHRTFGLPVVITNCSNNYGPYQFPEKLIPLMIVNAIEGLPLPIYGGGDNVRDWLFVEDHAEALLAAATRGRPGETYAIGGSAERHNTDVVLRICALLDELRPDSPHVPHERLIRFVEDRPGHDHRYAIDAAKIQRELGWRPRFSFEQGLRETVGWYLANAAWWGPLRSGVYGGERLGLGARPRPDGSSFANATPLRGAPAASRSAPRANR